VLTLLPDDWVVEHVEVVHVELAVESQRLPHVQRERSAFRDHHQNRYNSMQSANGLYTAGHASSIMQVL